MKGLFGFVDGLKFNEISTELWPLIYVKISFPASVLCIYCPICFKICIKVHIRKKWFGIVNSIKYLQSYGPSFMTKFCSAHYLENLSTKIFCAFVLN